MEMLALDSDGFLLDRDSWTPAVAERLAQRLGIQLTPAHWRVIECVQEFYRLHQLSPAMRVLVKRLQHKQHADLASSLTLAALFPELAWAESDDAEPATNIHQLPITHIARGSPAKRIAGIAGLPRPTNCL